MFSNLPVLKYLGIALIALALGVGSALYWLVQSPMDSHWVKNGVWKVNLLAGSEQSGIYERARIAVAGLFALNRSETLYFVANSDDSGEPLRSACNYRIEGRDIDARWWSITAYGRTYFLIPNDQKRYSFNKNNITREADGLFRIYLSSTPREKNWIPSGHKDQKLHLNLRLYNPSPGVAENPELVEVPRIIREGCS